jgi:hypothetical protein
MNLLQYFHRKEVFNCFEVGDRVRLRYYPEDVRILYNKEYPNCAMNKKEWVKAWDKLINLLGNTNHIISGIKPGTPAAGNFFVSIDGRDTYYHSNIFELVK